MTNNEETNAVLSILHAAREGDLGARVHGPAATTPMGKAVNGLLDAFERRVGQAAYASTSILVAAEAARAVLPELADGLSRQQTAVGEIVRTLKALESRSEEIGHIVELLDDVASQTNILALNAALEASRAGAQGKGFGLVAEEVRKLAERSAAATKDIGAFLEGIADATSEATRAIEDVRKLGEHLTAVGANRGDDADLDQAKQALAGAFSGMRFGGQGETDLLRVVHERRGELERVLAPFSQLVADAESPLASALRSLLTALGTPSTPAKDA